MRRRPGRTAFALILPLALFVAFGMSRVTAPVGLIGELFDHPVSFAVAAAVTSLIGVVLMFVPPVERALARVMAGPSRPPTAAEAERIDRVLSALRRQAGGWPRRLIVRVIDGHGANAAAGAGHLLFVTSGALSLRDEYLEAVLAHELGHHRGLHPVITAVVWWLSLPGEALAAVYRLLRRAVRAVTGRLGTVGALVAVPLILLVRLWELLVMWVYWIGVVLAARASRLSEFEADAAAARWGYAVPLADALVGLEGAPAAPGGRLEQLMASHPPTETRVERLRSARDPAAPR